MNKRKDFSKYIIGRKVGFLTVIEATDEYNKHNNRCYICECECGKKTKLFSTCLREKASWKPSCGCQKIKYENRCDGRKVSENMYFLKYQAGAKRRNLDWELDKEHFLNLSKQNCYYCNLEPQPYNAYANQKRYQTKNNLLERSWINVNGIDRVDNHKGYLIDNSVSCCTKCNFAKRHYSQQEFLNWVNRISEFQFGKRN